jgi:hypothetical protein
MIAKANIDLAKSELVRQALKFWFADNDHIRSPFPQYIQVETQRQSVKKFGEWLDHLTEKAKDDVNDEILAEKFEECLFEAALELVEEEDERITLLYPFLPRIGDPVSAQVEGPAYQPSQVQARKLISEGDNKFLQLEMKENTSDKKWETKIELPG